MTDSRPAKAPSSAPAPSGLPTPPPEPTQPRGGAGPWRGKARPRKCPRCRTDTYNCRGAYCAVYGWQPR